MRQFILLILLACVVSTAQAQSYPTRLELAKGDSSLFAALQPVVRELVKVDSLAHMAIFATISDPRAYTPEEQGTVGIKFDIELKAVHLASGREASKRTISFDGKGPTAALARRVAMRKLNSAHVDLNSWGRTFAAEYVSFFRNNCDSLLAMANRNAADNPLKAYALAASIPENVACSKEAVNLAHTLYLNYQDKMDSVHLQRAQLAADSNLLDQTLSELALIDPQAADAAKALSWLDTLLTSLPETSSQKAALVQQQQTFRQKALWDARRKLIQRSLMDAFLLLPKEEKWSGPSRR